jgi:O-antigen biosynthesis protein
MLAPLRFGAGVKGKVLLSLAHGVPCVMSAIAAEGLDLPGPLRNLVVAGDDESFVRKALRFDKDDGLWRQASGLALEWAERNLSPAAIDAAFAEALAATPAAAREQLSA